MGDFRYDANGNVRYEPGDEQPRNLAEAAAAFDGDWDADLAALDAQPTSMGQLEQAITPKTPGYLADVKAAREGNVEAMQRLRRRGTDEAIANGTFLLGVGAQAEQEQTLGDAFRDGIVRGCEAVLGKDTSHGDGEPPLPPDDPDDDSHDGGDDDDDGTLELILGCVILVLAGATVVRILGGVWGWLT